MVDQFRAFFDTYEAAYNPPNLQAIAGAFAEDFIMTSAEGCGSNHNGPRFVQELQQVGDFYRQIGMRGLRIVSYAETLLDERHALVKITWSMRDRKGDEIIRFDISYVVGTPERKPAILLFISHNETERLMQKGLMPD